MYLLPFYFIFYFYLFIFITFYLYSIFFQASKMWIQNKMDESKHDIHSQVDAITAGTASVVNLTAGKALAVLKSI